MPGVQDLVVLVGLQGAGKSTLVASRFTGTHRVVSKDAWPNARRRQQRQMTLISELLAEDLSVVVDNTNPTVEDRAPLIAMGRAAGATTVGIYLNVPVTVCHARNAAREGRARVPDVGFYATVGKLVAPTLAEGFDRIETVT